jgi:hypothetical protein
VVAAGVQRAPRGAVRLTAEPTATGAAADSPVTDDAGAMGGGIISAAAVRHDYRMHVRCSVLDVPKG